MAEFEFQNGTAELTFGALTYELPLSGGELERLRSAALTLSERTVGCDDADALREMILDTVDEILGVDASAAILREKKDYTLFDALDIFRFIYTEYAEAFKRRVDSCAGRRGKR